MLTLIDRAASVPAFAGVLDVMSVMLLGCSCHIIASVLAFTDVYAVASSFWSPHTAAGVLALFWRPCPVCCWRHFCCDVFAAAGAPAVATVFVAACFL